MSKLTQKRLKNVLHYNPSPGLFIWIKARADHIGKVAGSKSPKGYILINIDGRKYMAHRLAVFWMNGRWPRHQVDHKDTVRDNNRWSNIRCATGSQNAFNRRPRAKCGFKGVVVNKYTGRFQANITKNGNRKILGTFDSAEKAHAAYAAAAKKLFGRFLRLSF